MAQLVDNAIQPRTRVLLPTEDRLGPADRRALELLETGFGVPFALIDGRSGELLFRPEGTPDSGWQLRGELCRVVASRGRPEIIQDEDPFAVLAVPLAGLGGDGRVAVGTFIVRPVQRREDVSDAARILGMSPDTAFNWGGKQIAWARPSLERVARMAIDHGRTLQAAKRSEEEIESVSQNLANTYEEISLLHRLTHNLRISRSDEELGRLALKWLADVVPARALVLQMLPREQEDDVPTAGPRRESSVIIHGDSPIDGKKLAETLSLLDICWTSQPVVINDTQMGRSDWPLGEIRQLVADPLSEGDRLFGHLAEINHIDDLELGTVE